MAGRIRGISMPKWGMEMAEGTIANWMFAVGDTVSAGDDLVEIETAKILNTLVAHDGGTLRRILAPEGETFAVGALIGVLSDGEVAEAEIDAFIAAAGKVRAESAQAGDEAPVAVPATESSQVASVAGVSANASPVARRIALAHGIDLARLSGSGRAGRIGKRDVEKAIEATGGKVERYAGAPPRRGANTRDDSAVPASSVARRLARQLGVNLLDCRRGGHHGRVGKADVEAVHALMNPDRPLVKSRAPGTAAAVRERPLGAMRRTIAARLQASKQSAPHYRVTVEAEVDALLALRRQLNELEPDWRLSVNDLLIKASAMALTRVPRLNVQFDGNTLREFSDADISVAVALEEGLITPIVRAANRLDLPQIAERSRDLAERARAGKLRSEEFQGGTFCISNLGMHGVRQFDAIINPPQVSILAVGAAEPRPVVRDGTLVPATLMTLTLSSDHRVVDGALAAEFLGVLKRLLQNPVSLLL